MRLSEEGMTFLKVHEGIITHIYDDGVGYLTGGVGHKLTENELKLWQKGYFVPNCQVDIWLREDVKAAEKAVEQLVITQLSQKGFDALVSFVFNVGVTAFKNSTLLRKLNLGLVEEAAEEFPRWNKARGKVLPGLIKRRAEEKELFLQGELVEFP